MPCQDGSTFNDEVADAHQAASQSGLHGQDEERLHVEEPLPYDSVCAAAMNWEYTAVRGDPVAIYMPGPRLAGLSTCHTYLGRTGPIGYVGERSTAVTTRCSDEELLPSQQIREGDSANEPTVPRGGTEPADAET